MRDHLPGPDVRELTAIFAGGMLGALGRVGLGQALQHAPAAWPWPTLAVNLLGALLLGWTVARLPPRSYGRPFLGIGVCGALTTFSTFSFETLRLLEEHAYVHAAANVVLSLVAGVVALFGGWSLATTLF